MNNSKKPDLLSSELLYFDERGSGSPLLLVHGLMATGEMFEPVAGQLASHYHLVSDVKNGHESLILPVALRSIVGHIPLVTRSSVWAVISADYRRSRCTRLCPALLPALTCSDGDESILA